MATILDADLRMWRACSWALVLMLLGIGFCWMLYLPTVGKGGLFLAVGATLMPLFWEKIGVVGKMSWIAMLFLLLTVEYRAIDHEHHLNDIAQQEALRAIGNGFTGVLSDQRNGFASLITQSEMAFKKTTEQASAQFDATMNRAQENLNHMTGGNSYPIVEVIPLPMANTMNKMKLSLAIIGGNPLFDVYVTLRKLPMPKVLNATEFITNGTQADVITELTASSISPTMAPLLPVPVEPSLSGQSDYMIVTNARNGVFTETLHIRNLGNVVADENGLILAILAWEQSYEIKRYNGRKDKLIKKSEWHKTFAAGSSAIPQQPN